MPFRAAIKINLYFNNLLNLIVHKSGIVVILCTVIFLSGCDPRPDRIGVSNTLIDFGLNETPFALYVWNGFKIVPLMRIEAEADVDWIQLSPASVDSLWKDENSGYDKRSIIVRINRSLLDIGEHKGYIRLTSSGMRPVNVEVRVRMEEDGRPKGLNIIDPISLYSEPYLLDFTFSLREADGNAVEAEPAQFDIEAYEDSEPTQAFETGLALRAAPSRQLLVDFVLDYSLSIQNAFGAIASLEEAARNDILRYLNSEAAVGITVFSREDRDPLVVSDLTTDQALIRNELSLIQEEYITRYTSGAALFDALMISLDKFDEGFFLDTLLGAYEDIINIIERFTEKDSPQQSRQIFVITDGYDTSSEATLDDVTRRARNLNVHINVVGIGNRPNLTTLLSLAGLTKGEYFSYDDEREALSPYVQEIVQNLEGQYQLRWATLSRRDAEFIPSFLLSLNGREELYTADNGYNPVDYAGDTLCGVITSTLQDDGLRSSIDINAEYIPRFTYDLRLYVEASHPFEVAIAETVNGGLLETWELETTTVEGNGLWMHFYSFDSPLPFAGYGPLFSLDFGEVIDAERPALTSLDVDNSLYNDAIYFVVEEGQQKD